MTTHYPKGHLLSVQFPLYHHVGISDGCGHVYENSRARSGRGLVSLLDFSDDKVIIDHGFLPGSLSASDIIINAKQLIADKKRYHLLKNNCEHFVHEVCGVKITSPQLRRALILIATLLVDRYSSGRLRSALLWSIASQLSHLNEASLSWWKHAIFTSTGFWLVLLTNSNQDIEDKTPD
ncbi:lecithin retinol acyltransferase family protein [Moritella viscosa]|uniref:LRAT domain-containing protein n=1 Tax=Moritella viscosa TaxID=80854 RepID=A0A090IIH0_9GAMM|nr:lecithin retinol acyltransferase family protein [Moritella viscosa]CED59884.1 putative uncharacterized protein [Moritella viscosa]SGY87386.1 Putative uncharacterized protein [Moritella viscosa]SGY90462.1 Putative uncharacterized protein [Moritella viscosa]SGY90477.1 Putative uncharacterized protein [Moritella viscosa]SGY93044.1 Putative uncharacterized protein [Moritella viscosa]